MSLKILIGCECSAVVRDEFRKLGHDTWSCDLKPCERDSAWHIQGDIFEVIASRDWDLGIFHPPCDFLTVSCNKWFSDTITASPEILTGQARREARNRSVKFVKRLWSAPIESIAIENPIGRLSTLWMEPSQIIEPFHFGDPFKKATCLWLKNLPRLVWTNNLGSGEQACWKMPPGDRKSTRLNSSHIQKSRMPSSA